MQLTVKAPAVRVSLTVNSVKMPLPYEDVLLPRVTCCYHVLRVVTTIKKRTCDHQMLKWTSGEMRCRH
jgi:hypothetical protein